MEASWVFTGAGLVTAAGDTPQALFAALAAGSPRAAVHPETGFPVVACASFDAKTYLKRKGVKDLSRTSQLACAAAAGNAAGIAGVPVEEVGVVLGSAWGSLTTVVSFEREAFVQGPRFVDPILFTETVANVPAGQVAIFFGWSAFNATVSAGSASGLAGVLRALDFLVEGRGTIAVAGGADELNLPLLRSLHARQLLAPGLGCLPLSASLTGPIGGEGACFLTLESDEHARARAASPMARIRSSAARFAASRATPAHSTRASLAELLRELLVRAEIESRDVDLLVLSAAGRPVGDADEGGAVLDVFGAGPDAPLVVAPKGVLGESWGASGPLAIVIAIEALRTETVPGAPLGFVAARGLEGLRVPSATCPCKIRNAIVVDRSDAGHQFGIVLSAVERRDERE